MGGMARMAIRVGDIRRFVKIKLKATILSNERLALSPKQVFLYSSYHVFKDYLYIDDVDC